MEWLDRHAGAGVCYLTTRGRRTGRPHTIEIWFATDGGRLYMLSGGGDSADWVRNVRAAPEVTVRIRDEEQVGRARFVVDADEDARARRLLAAKYQGWRDGQPLSGWAQTALPVAVELAGAP